MKQRAVSAPGNPHATGGFASTPSRPTRSSGKKSIRTKLTLVMSGASAAVLLAMFLFTIQLTSSNSATEVKRSGAAQAKSSHVTGRLFSEQLSERALLTRLSLKLSETKSSDVSKAYDKLGSAWGYSGAGVGYHPARSQTSFERMRDDFLWTSAANALDFAKASPESLELMLGQGYLDARDNRERAPRALNPTWGQLPWPKNTNATPQSLQALAKSDAIRKATSELVAALIAAANADVTKELRATSDASGRENQSQVLGMVYIPSKDQLAWIDNLAGEPRLVLAADTAPLREKAIVRVGSNLLEGNASGDAKPSGTFGDVTYYDGSLEVSGKNLDVREFVFKANAGEEVRVLINTAVVNEARSSMIFMLTLVALAGLVASIVVSVFLGRAIARPIQDLMQDVTRIASGDFQYRPPVRSKDEIGTLSRLVGEMAGSLSVGQQMWQENQASRHDVSMAKEIQDNLLPSIVPEIPGYDIGVYYEPSKEVGGDYYDFFTVDRDHLGMVCADVSGKGIPGSMVMMMAKALITNNARKNYSPRDIFIKTNQVLAPDIKRGMFVTAYYALLDASTRELRVSSAGHNAMLIFRSTTNEILSVNPSGIALGFDRDGALFEKNVQEEIVELRIGDRVVIYTDGVTEATNKAGEEFGEDRLKAAMQGYGTLASNDFLFRLVNEIEGFAQSDDQHDDITILTFMVNA